MIWLILKKLSYSMFLILLFMACFDLGSSYQKHHAETKDDFNQWLNMKQIYKPEDKLILDTLDNPLIYTYSERIEDYNKVINSIRLSLLFICLVSFFDYFYDKEEHWFTKVKHLIKNNGDT